MGWMEDASRRNRANLEAFASEQGFGASKRPTFNQTRTFDLNKSKFSEQKRKSEDEKSNRDARLALDKEKLAARVKENDTKRDFTLYRGRMASRKEDEKEALKRAANTRVNASRQGNPFAQLGVNQYLDGEGKVMTTSQWQQGQERSRSVLEGVNNYVASTGVAVTTQDQLDKVFDYLREEGTLKSVEMFGYDRIENFKQGMQGLQAQANRISKVEKSAEHVVQDEEARGERVRLPEESVDFHTNQGHSPASAEKAARAATALATKNEEKRVAAEHSDVSETFDNLESNLKDISGRNVMSDIDKATEHLENGSFLEGATQTAEEVAQSHLHSSLISEGVLKSAAAGKAFRDVLASNEIVNKLKGIGSMAVAEWSKMAAGYASYGGTPEGKYFKLLFQGAAVVGKRGLMESLAASRDSSKSGLFARRHKAKAEKDAGAAAESYLARKFALALENPSGAMLPHIRKLFVSKLKRGTPKEREKFLRIRELMKQNSAGFRKSKKTASDKAARLQEAKDATENKKLGRENQFNVPQ